MKIRPLLGFTLLLAVLGTTLAACGGDSEPEPEGTVLPTCSGEALADTGLAADFPIPEGVTFVAQTTAGPSNVLDGFADDTVDHLFGAWKDAFEQANYAILFDENEAPDDAEISYRSPDETREGQVALRNECGGGDKIAVHMTDRPA
jgi:hypothetical protein